jgi:hypothetical protein
MRFVKQATVNASADQVWSIFAHDFDNAYKWMASIPHSYAQANGELFVGAESAGRVCELSPSGTGMKASEKFLAYDEATKTCTVRIDFVDTPLIFPVQYNTLDFKVTETGEQRSEMTWVFRSQIKPWAYLMWPLIRIGFGAGVGRIAEELKFYVENGTSHPRKVAAMKRLENAA